MIPDLVKVGRAQPEPLASRVAQVPQVADVRRVGTRPPTSKSVGAARKAGLRYEAQVSDLLSGGWPSYLPVEWFSYLCDGKRQMCQPDGILPLEHYTVIVEVKLSHTERAWSQLREKYQPVLQTYWPQRTLRVVEICKNYSPIALPEEHKLLPSPQHLEYLTEDLFHILPWRP